ncbi:MAG TPA: PH domain-containing protein [Patescibacteria group bacterium]|nr:PH domain-containing protein [Patescibacteria group bacterium]
MRCPQCGNDSQQGAAFCARCGTRLFAPKPASVREYALAQFRPSLWYYANGFLVGGVVIAIGARLLYGKVQQAQVPVQVGFAIVGVGVLIFIVTMIRARTVSWNLTSDRLIEKRGLVASRKREMELSDIRSVEVAKRVFQRMFGLGDVTIASAASADYAIRLNDIYDPDEAAETIRKARLKRLA